MKFHIKTLSDEISHFVQNNEAICNIMIITSLQPPY